RLRQVREVVARSAMGAVGMRGVGAPELDLVGVQKTGIPRRVVNRLGAAARRPARLAEAAFGSGRGATAVEEGRTNSLGLVLALGRPAAIDGRKDPVLLFGLPESSYDREGGRYGGPRQSAGPSRAERPPRLASRD